MPRVHAQDLCRAGPVSAGRRRRRAEIVACGLALSLAVMAAGGCGGSGQESTTTTAQGFTVIKPPPATDDPRPNFVVVVTDDQTLESYDQAVMPRTVRNLGGSGTTFSRAIVSTPQCCPSRAGYLTGQYSQNNDVTSNDPGYSLLRDKRNVLPSWLQAAGYETIHVGKYLNGYVATEGATPAPGWDRWMSLIDSDYRKAGWSIDGVEETYPGEHLTGTVNRLTVETIRRQAKRGRPFYLQVDHLAPHDGSGEETGECRGGPIPSSRDADAFPGWRAPRNRAAREVDVSDKPPYLERHPIPGRADVANADRLYRCTLQSLQAVDRGIARMVSELRRVRELGSTMIVFTSDNGFAFLEHRVTVTKGMPYEEHLRVPLVIRPPRGFPPASRSGGVLNPPVANIDLAPTILDVADARPCLEEGVCRRMDGRSLLPLLLGQEPGWLKGRAIRTGFSIGTPTYGLSCSWDGLHTPKQVLVNHTLLPLSLTNECEPANELEYYDLGSDPFQLRGDGPIPPGLEARLDRLKRCSGIRSRDSVIEGTPFCE